MPDAGLLRALGVAVLCIKVALVPLVFDPTALVVFAVPKALVAHGLAVILACLLIAHVLTTGRRELLWTPLHSAVLVFLAVNAASALFATDTTVGLFGAHDRRLGLTTVADNAVLFLAVTVFIRTTPALLALGVGLGAGLAGALAYEALQVLGLDPLPWASGLSRERPFGTMGNAGALAQYLGTIGAGAFGLALSPRFRGDPSARAVLGVVAIAALAGGLATNTRALMLGIAASVVVFMAWLVFWTPARRAQLLAGVGLSVTILGVVAVGSGQMTRAIDALLVLTPTLTEDRALEVGSVGARVVLYRVAVDIVKEHPLLGVGPDNFVAAFPRHRPVEATRAFASTASQTSPHSWILHLVTSAGVIGLGVFLATLALATSLAIRRADPVRLAALVAIASFLGTGLVSINDVGTEWLVWLALGLIAVGEPTPRPAPARASRRHRRRRETERRSEARVIPVALTVVATVVVFAIQSQAWGAARAAEAARLARAVGDGQAAVQAAQTATEQDARRAEYWNALGLGYAGVGRFDRAARAFGRATELAAYESTYASNLARSYVAIGTSEAAANSLALETARDAVANDPNQPDLYYTLALALFANGHSADAVAAGEEALRRGAITTDGLVAERIGREYMQQGRLTEAEAWLRRSIGALSGRNSLDARLLLAEILLGQDRRQEALEAVNAVLAIDPSYEPALQLRSTIPSP